MAKLALEDVMGERDLELEADSGSWEPGAWNKPPLEVGERRGLMGGQRYSTARPADLQR